MSSHGSGIAASLKPAVVAVLSLALAGAPLPALAAPAEGESDPSAEAQALYEQGRTQYETADYDGAIESWTKAYAKIPNTRDMGAAKASLLYNLAKAHEDAFEIDDDLKHLKTAKKLLENFEGSIPQIYGEGAEADAERERVRARIAELDARIQEAKGKGPSIDPGEEEEETPEEGPDPEEPDEEEEKKKSAKSGDGTGAIVTGGVLVAAGAILGGVSIATGILSNGANDFEDVEDADGNIDYQAREDQILRGQALNGTAWTTGIIGGLVGVSGIVILSIGAAKRSKLGGGGKKDKKASLSPEFGPGYAGLGVSGRF